MNPVIRRLGFIFVGIFFVINVGVMVWQFGWVRPREQCEAAHKWWDSGQRVCATPILTSDITGRIIDNPEARQEALRAVGRLPSPPREGQAAPAVRVGK